MNVRPFHPSLHLARIGRPVRADAAGHELAAALQHRPDRHHRPAECFLLDANVQSNAGVGLILWGK